MDSLFFHPQVVHLPLALAVLLPFLAAAIAVAWWREWLPSRSWLIVAALQVVLTGSTFVAMQTGEEQEDRVEDIVGHDPVHEHEEAAEGLFWGSVATLVLSLGAALGQEKRFGLPLAGATALVGCAVLILAVRTGHAGGELVYKYGAASAYVNSEDSVAAPHGEEAD